MMTNLARGGLRRSIQFDALLSYYRDRPDGEAEPLKSNWSLVANNNDVDASELEQIRVERRLEIVPSIKTIKREMNLPPTRNAAGQIVAIGKLRFSDGDQFEKAYKRRADGRLVMFDARMRAGSMLGTSEEQTVLAGPAEDSSEVTMSNHYFAEVLDTRPSRYVDRSRNIRRGKSYTAAESRALLNEAIANTAVMPPVTYLPAGLPCGTRRVSGNFLGMKVGVSGKGGSTAWQDVFSAMAGRKIWADALEAMKATDVQVLDVAIDAKSYAELGVRLGQSTEYARRKGGKRALVAANDNLAEALERAAA